MGGFSWTSETSLLKGIHCGESCFRGLTQIVFLKGFTVVNPVFVD